MTDQTQGRDGLADTQVVGQLLRGLRRLRRLWVGQGRDQCRADRLATLDSGGRQCARVGVQTLHHLKRKGAPHATCLHAVKHCLAVVTRQQSGPSAFQTEVHRTIHAKQRCIGLIAPGVGVFACRVDRRHALAQAPQVFHQHHSQGGGQRPKLAQCQFTRLLVGVEELEQQRLAERTVGVRDKGPGDAVDTRQARQVGVGKYRQIAEVAPRQTVVDGLELLGDEVEVVQQPLAGGAHRLPAQGLRVDVAVGLAQHRDVVLQTRKERR